MTRFARFWGALVAVLVLFCLLSPATGGAAPGLRPIAGAMPAFFIQSGGAGSGQGSAWAPPPTQSAAAQGPTALPSSALNSPDHTCSVRTDSVPGPNHPAACSAGAQTGLRSCTVECDGGKQRCSAFHGSADKTAFCSTTGGASLSCSVLLPPASPPTGDAACSAGGGRNFGTILCSAKGPGRFQVCSVEEPPQSPVFLNICSAKNLFQAANRVECSVVHARAAKAACTAIRFGVGKFCSALSDTVACSAGTDSTGTFFGKCTSLRVAPPNSCSVLPGVTGAHCSVIGGASGDPCGAH